MFAKPECDNVLQSEQRSGEGCNILSHEGLANVRRRGGGGGGGVLASPASLHCVLEQEHES